MLCPNWRPSQKPFLSHSSISISTATQSANVLCALKFFYTFITNISTTSEKDVSQSERLPMFATVLSVSFITKIEIKTTIISVLCLPNQLRLYTEEASAHFQRCTILNTGPAHIKNSSPSINSTCPANTGRLSESCQFKTVEQNPDSRPL